LRTAIGKQELNRAVEALRLHRGHRRAYMTLLVEHGDEHADVEIVLVLWSGGY
jgi:hypothetical protein